MEKKLIKKILFLFIVINFIGCLNDDKCEKTINNLKNTNQQLKIQITNLKAKVKQLEQKINEPKKLIFLANKYIKEGKGDKAKEILIKLINTYPEKKNDLKIKNLLKKSKELIQRKKKENEQLLKKINKFMIVDKDIVEDITWYVPKFKYCTVEDTILYAYIGQDNKTKKPWLRIYIDYVNKDWLFIHKFVIKTDNNQYVYEKKFKGKVLDNGEVKEWIDFYADKQDIKMLHDLATTKKFLIRFYGKNSLIDYVKGYPGDHYAASTCLIFGIDSLPKTLKIFNILMEKYKNNKN